jgi:hypothetical protein
MTDVFEVGSWNAEVGKENQEGGILKKPPIYFSASRLPSLQGSQPPSFQASQPPSFPASQLSSLPAFQPSSL